MGTRYDLLDLFCGAGGCTRGYQLAGFRVTGVDNVKQPRYVGDEFVLGDALEYVGLHGREFDAIHASPPCQAYSKTWRIRKNIHPDLIGSVRELLVSTGRPYVIENVVGAPLADPIILSGVMFGLRVVRKRLFECNFDIPMMLNFFPVNRHAKMGRVANDGEYIFVVGKGGSREVNEQWRMAMEIDWMTIKELAQAIPPAYTKYIGEYLKRRLDAISDGK